MSRSVPIPGKFACPRCGGELDAVKDSRPETLFGFKVIERRRLCSRCGKRSLTLEMTEADMAAMSKMFETARKERVAALLAEIEALQ